jgi:hypothetical protein
VTVERLKAGLKRGRNSYALLSLGPSVRRAIMFFHGFTGDSVRTWMNFQGLVDEVPAERDWWAESDLYFYGYHSVCDRIAASAYDFSSLICAIYPRPDPTEFHVEHDLICDGTFLGRRSFDVPSSVFHTYDELVLVGHSQGGLVLRKAILDLAKRRMDESDDSGPEHSALKSILDARLKLFAPALLGASPSKLLAVLLRLPVIDSVTNAVLSASGAYGEMERGSGVLDSIRHQTERFAERYPSAAAFRARVLWGREESFVAMGEYECDLVVQVVEGRDHKTVCKPNSDFLLPLEFVRCM